MIQRYSGKFLAEMDQLELDHEIDLLESALDDEDRGGPPGWRRSAEEKLREAKRLLKLELWREDLLPEEEDDGK
jgi:hypothetical protein